ncbi:MAG: hypothetical protein ABI567_06880 [Gammaproteobacteria bacterium]
MNRGALAVAGVLIALGVLAWLLTPHTDSPAIPDRAAATESSAPVAGVPPLLEPEAAPPAAAPAKPAGAIPRVGTRDELLAALKARGLDGEQLLAGYRDWRFARGFLGAEPLAGVPAGNAPSQVYATMDRTTLKNLADSGDVGALQAYAVGSLPDDPFTAIEYLGRASERGSAAAMVEIAGILAKLGDPEPGAAPRDAAFENRLLALRGGDPNRDLREDAAAWTLAAIRQYGPILATPASLRLVEQPGGTGDPARALVVCGRSLAILADLSAATAGQDSGSLPPVFVAERDLYGRLPCRDTPVPVMPPRVLAGCTSSPALGSDNRPVELWICPGG